jgi:hypothetical protein
MSKLKTIKGKAKLAEFTDFVALKPHEVRWNGAYRMFNRYVEFYESLIQISMENSEIGKAVAGSLPTHLEHREILEVSKDLNRLHSVSLLLQKENGNVNLAEARDIFDHVINDFGQSFEYYMAENAKIIPSPSFEISLVKAIRNEKLSRTDEENLRSLELQSNRIVASEAGDFSEPLDDYALNILNTSRKKRKVISKYMNLTSIPVTSNIVERFFSQAKLNLTTLRNTMLPSTLEGIMFLKINCHLWGKLSVQRAIRK